MFGPLINAAKQGYQPKTVIDVGAFQGLWFTEAVKIFPQAKFHIFEPQWSLPTPLILRECKEAITSNFKLHNVLLGASYKSSVPFYVMEGGSGVLNELTKFPRKVVNMPMFTLDECLEPIEGPCLLKLDTQGYELEVLKGGLETLEKVDMILTEVSTLPYNEGAPLFAEVIAFMKLQGFVVYDFGVPARRQADQTLFQTDVYFVRENHFLRKHKQFWNRESVV